MLNAQEAQTGYVNLNNYDDLFNQIEVFRGVKNVKIESKNHIN